MAHDKENIPQPNPDQGSLELLEEYIRLRAYELFLQRGCEHGHDTEDWLKAEAEILGKRSSSADSAVVKSKKAAA
jgi:hypothetical protein